MPLTRCSQCGASPIDDAGLGLRLIGEPTCPRCAASIDVDPDRCPTCAGIEAYDVDELTPPDALVCVCYDAPTVSPVRRDRMAEVIAHAPHPVTVPAPDIEPTDTRWEDFHR